MTGKRSALWLAALCTSLFAAVLVAACGGGVGSGGTGSFASGPITGFGSVIVNDVRFDDNTAVVEDGDGVRRSRDDLRLGMTVDVDSGEISNGSSGATAVASRIRYDSELRGPVSSVDVPGKAFNLLGQRVVVDVTTAFDDSLGGLDTLALGVAVEVYAVYDPAGARYRAKRVARAAAGASVQLRGPVTQVDTVARTLRIGNTVYSYGNASGVPADLVAGQYVRLRVASAPVLGRWPVLSFALALQALADADGGSLKGLITSFSSAASFNVNGRPVDASNARFPDGQAGLGLGVRVEVKGNLRLGTLRASEVKIQSDEEEDGREFEISGPIQAIDAAAQTLTLRTVNISTARPDLVYQNGSAANLLVGRRIEVRGRLSANGLRVEATRIEFR
jgi:hypothetical protein